MAKLIDITGKAISGEWGNDDETGNGIPVLRTTNFTNTGIINFSNVITRDIQKKNISEKYLRNGDIIIEKSGGSDTQPVGRVIFFEAEENKYLFNNFTGLLRVKDKTLCFPKYLFYFLFSNYQKGGTIPFQNKTTGLHNLKTDDYVKKCDVPLPTLETQRKIASNLDKVTHTIDLCNAILEKLDLLVKSRFVEMFGDLIENDRQWENHLLCNIADIVSGITKGRKVKGTELIEVPYMAVSNVKDGYIDWTTVKTILATVSEIEQYRIQPEDILMTEGGDPDKLGRGAIIHQVPENCIHQNHIFRVRLDEAIILPLYFSEYLQAQKAKRYFFSCAKQTTGIASINMKQLKALPVLVPPLALQERFAAFVEQTDKSKLAVKQVLEKAETLKKALMQEYFG